MQLKLAVAGKEIAAVPLDASRASDRAYLAAKQRLLALACRHLLNQPSAASPVFYIQVASKMNRKTAKA